jgi:Large ribosomal RNA subunit accumulation protein YceD
MTRPERMAERLWSVPLALSDVPESGRHSDLVADEQARNAVARHAGLAALPRLEASFDVTLHGRGGLHVVGRVSATVGQTCVVTLEPLSNEIEEEIDLLYMRPAEAAAATDEESEAEAEPKSDEPEPLIGGTVDLGVLATEFLLLGLDPYPRKPGAVFEAPRDNRPEAGPFAGLAGLMKNRDGS